MLVELVTELRPALHRYCARMTGSVVDGEDALQDALAHAFAALAAPAAIDNPRAWLYRVAHNAALDLVRRRARAPVAEEDADMADPAPSVDARLAAATALRTFMRLPPGQRSSVILVDVLGHSLEEVATILDTSVAAVKAYLHRGRTRLRELAGDADDAPAPVLAGRERELLLAYIDRFNAHDFDAVRAMLAEEVRLDLVARHGLRGKAEVQNYFTNYAARPDWHLVPGTVEGRAAVLVCDRAAPAGPPLYFVLLEWQGDKLTFVRDFRYARYVLDGAEVLRLPVRPSS